MEVTFLQTEWVLFWNICVYNERGDQRFEREYFLWLLFFCILCPSLLAFILSFASLFVFLGEQGRKGMNFDEREAGRMWKEFREVNQNQNILCEKIYFK